MNKAQQRIAIEILCEDSQHQTFFYQLLQKLGFFKRKIYFKPPPQRGRGGYAVVLAHLPELIKKFRSRSSSQPALRQFIVIDQDGNDRFALINKALEDDQQLPLQPTEQIYLFLPARNIETWIHWLRGESVDETKTYDKLKRAGMCQDAVDRLVELVLSEDKLPEGCPSSLVSAISELRRLRMSVPE